MNIAVTGLGSWPGTDFAGVQRMLLGELPELPHVPELPARGIGSDMIGRAVAVVAELGLDLQPAGWRLTDAPGIDHRRARARWREDLDLLEEAAQGYVGPLKLAFAGPWTMAGMVEKPRGDRVLADHGARRDLAAALAEGIAATVVEVARRLPGVEPVVQIDEPLLPSVRAGRIRTASGFSRFRSVDVPELSGTLTALVDTLTRAYAAGPRTVLHCCAAGLDVASVYAAGFDAVAVPAAKLGGRDRDAIAAAVERGRQLWLGVVPTEVPDRVPRPDALAATALAVVRPLELGPLWADRLVLTPACGLAGWSARTALPVLRQLREAAGIVADELTR